MLNDKILIDVNVDKMSISDYLLYVYMHGEFNYEFTQILKSKCSKSFTIIFFLGNVFGFAFAFLFLMITYIFSH